MPRADRPPVLLVTTFAGDPGLAELERRAAAGERPRKDYVELARRLGATVVDDEYMRTRAGRLARAVSRRWMPAGQILEAFLRHRRLGDMVVWADRLAVGLGGLLKLIGSRRRMVFISVALSTPKKALPFRLLRLHTQFREIVTMGTTQRTIATEQLGVDPAHIHFLPPPVDLRFWAPDGRPEGRTICAVGWEARDYPTLFRAVEGLEVEVEAAVGSAFAPDESGVAPPRFPDGVPDNVRVHENMKPPELRALYRRSQIVVVPLHDVDFDAGMTVIIEAMGMGRPVIVTRTRGQVDVVREGENGLYVAPGDSDGMRDAISRLLADPDEAERLGRAGRAFVEEHHSLDRFVERVASLVAAGAPASR